MPLDLNLFLEFHRSECQLDIQRVYVFQGHSTTAPVTKPDHGMHGGPAGRVHTFINTKVTVSSFVDVCTQLTCRCGTSDDYVQLLYRHSRKTWEL